jgi:hypothetical protein
MLNLEELCPRGEKCTVFALVVDGRAEAAEWLAELPEDVFGKLMAVACRLAANGFIPNEQKLRRLDSGIFELKVRHPPVRLFCFRLGQDWVCTHGDEKPGRRELRGHIAKVKTLRQRLLEERA